MEFSSIRGTVSVGDEAWSEDVGVFPVEAGGLSSKVSGKDRLKFSPVGDIAGKVSGVRGMERVLLVVMVELGWEDGVWERDEVTGCRVSCMFPVLFFDGDCIPGRV